MAIVTTGFGQGVRRSTASIAAILGPLWAGASLHQYYLLLGVPLGILTGLMVSTHLLVVNVLPFILYTHSF